MKPTLPPAPPDPNGEALDPLAEAEGLSGKKAAGINMLLGTLRHEPAAPTSSNDARACP